MLSEVECYYRCYGSGDRNEELRRLFELRLDARAPELAA